MPLPKTLKIKPSQAKRKEPLWKGPMDQSDMGGVTQSMLSRFLVCRERFRLRYIEGIRPVESFDPKIEVGHMWHACEEALAKTPLDQSKVFASLLDYGKKLIKKYPMEQEQVDHWYRWVKAVFPEYILYWSKHKDVVHRKPLLQEHPFNVPYKLPSSRIVYLRGKYDSVDLVSAPMKGKSKLSPSIWLQENKTKSDLAQEKITRQLRFDLQTMFYLTALTEDPMAGYESEGHYASDTPPYPIAGVRYNCIWRNCPIRRHKAKQTKKGSTPEETKEHFYERLLNDYVRPNPEQWFMRWNVTVPPSDITNFRRKCLDPILEQLCDWYEWIGNEKDPFQPDVNANVYHWIHPYGVYNVMNEGGCSDIDEYMLTGSMSGMRQVDTLFEELQ